MVDIFVFEFWEEEQRQLASLGFGNTPDTLKGLCLFLAWEHLEVALDDIFVKRKVWASYGILWQVSSLEAHRKWIVVRVKSGLRNIRKGNRSCTHLCHVDDGVVRCLHTTL